MIQERYFAASNSERGFVNYFPQIFGEGRCRRLYVVKGGPGTGKSCFMRQVAHGAEQHGHKVTYYYCSSDPDSLDGIWLREMGVAMIDGTAPHAWEPTLIGAFEQTVNLGDFWDAERLAERRESIEALGRAKSAAYREAYEYLAAYGRMIAATEARRREAVNMEKMERAAERFLKQQTGLSAEGYAREIALCDSFGMSGRVRFDTYEREATQLYTLEDRCDTAYLFMDAIHAACRTRGVRVRLSYHPILPGRIDAMTFPDNGTTLVTHSAEGDRIHMRRFVKEDGRGLRGRIKERMALADAALACASEALSEVRRYHFALEQLYGDTMDFEAKQSFTERFCAKLFS